MQFVADGLRETAKQNYEEIKEQTLRLNQRITVLEEQRTPTQVLENMHVSGQKTPPTPILEEK